MSMMHPRPDTRFWTCSCSHETGLSAGPVEEDAFCLLEQIFQWGTESGMAKGTEAEMDVSGLAHYLVCTLMGFIPA